MKKKLLISLAALACLLVAGAVVFLVPSLTPSRSKDGKAAAGQKRGASPQGEIERAEQTIENLKPQFNFSENESSGDYFCWHQLSKFQFIDETTITAYIHHDSSGFNIVLTSAYVQGDKIFSSNEPFYDTILVKIGLKTKKIVTYANEPSSTPRITIGYETNDRFDDENKETMLRFIADNPNREVRIQLNETGETYGYTLQKEQHQAICQTVELYDALKVLERAKESGAYPKDDYLKELFLNTPKAQTGPANAK